MLNLHGTFLPVIDGHTLIGVQSAHTLDSSILILALEGVPPSACWLMR
jgi:hypothetical protein